MLRVGRWETQRTDLPAHSYNHSKGWGVESVNAFPHHLRSPSVIFIFFLTGTVLVLCSLHFITASPHGTIINGSTPTSHSKRKLRLGWCKELLLDETLPLPFSCQVWRQFVIRGKGRGAGEGREKPNPSPPPHPGAGTLREL